MLIVCSVFRSWFTALADPSHAFDKWERISLQVIIRPHWLDLPSIIPALLNIRSYFSLPFTHKHITLKNIYFSSSWKMNKRWLKYEITGYKWHNAKHIIAQNIVRFRFENLRVITPCSLAESYQGFGGDLLPPFSRKLRKPHAKAIRKGPTGYVWTGVGSRPRSSYLHEQGLPISLYLAVPFPHGFLFYPEDRSKRFLHNSVFYTKYKSLHFTDQ